MGLKEFSKRGEVYLVCLDPTIGSETSKTRSALIISNDINNQISDIVTVIPITSNTEKVYPFEVFFSSNKSGLYKNSKAKCNQIRTVDKKRLIKSLGSITPEKLKEIENALRIHLGMY
ncbi:MAG: type II toxin-antitoxin system PemK/MazF family toxin [Actinobacteria bacterium]|nr:type II toxin-antitoxin system PemK/MazF family toxin [Actinomycetota bacterium]